MKAISKLFFLTFAVLFFNGCSPFGNYSSIEIKDLTNIFSKTTQMDMNSGGHTAVTAQSYKVNYTVGTQLRQRNDQKMTQNGYTVLLLQGGGN
jgi:hypothetical protein